MTRLDFYEAPPTWGAWTPPAMAAERLNVDHHLKAVPEGGTVVDVGAGIALSLSAYIYSVRPDVRIVPVDPGYGIPDIEWELEDVRGATIEQFDEATQARLEASDEWYKHARSAPAEELPVDDSSVDLLLSHAAIPDYATDPKLALEECVRVLKLGTVAAHGPMHRWAFEPWCELLQEVQSAAGIATFECEERMMDVGVIRPMSGFFTIIQK